MHEVVEGPVEDGLGVAHLVVRSMVLHELVRVEHVRANLTPEADVLRSTSLLRELGLSLLLLELGESGPEDPQRRLLRSRVWSEGTPRQTTWPAALARR